MWWPALEGPTPRIDSSAADESGEGPIHAPSSIDFSHGQRSVSDAARSRVRPALRSKCAGRPQSACGRFHCGKPGGQPKRACPPGHLVSYGCEFLTHIPGDRREDSLSCRNAQHPYGGSLFPSNEPLVEQFLVEGGEISSKGFRVIVYAQFGQASLKRCTATAVEETEPL